MEPVVVDCVRRASLAASCSGKKKSPSSSGKWRFLSEGLYWIGFEYYPMPGKRASAMRDMKINGVYPFNEARRLQFERVWRDANLPKQDNQGNDIRPIQIETPEWQFKWFEDSDTMYRDPFLWPLEEGVNRIEIRSIREPMAVKTLVIAVAGESVRPTPKCWQNIGQKDIKRSRTSSSNSRRRRLSRSRTRPSGPSLAPTR